MGTSKEKIICELPDVQEFLKLSRIFMRQNELLQRNNIPEQYKELVKNAAKKVRESLEKFI
jgi:hypothetical protein